MPSVWMNGSLIDEAAATLPTADTGLLHAAGLFTTMRAYHGRVFRLEAHLQRLRRSCQAFSIPLRFDDDELTAAVDELLVQNQLGEARLRLTITRGVPQGAPNIFLSASELQPYPQEFYERGMTVLLLDEQKLNPYDMQAGHKTLNYFSRLGGLRSATLRSAGEALWFNVHNYLQSGSVSNVFVIRDGTLWTPPTPEEVSAPGFEGALPAARSAVLPGVTRATVIELAEQLNLPVKRLPIDVNQLLDAHELFLTNSIMQIMPVTRIEKSVVGADQPGPITRRLSDALNTLILEQCRP